MTVKLEIQVSYKEKAKEKPNGDCFYHWKKNLNDLTPNQPL